MYTPCLYYSNELPGLERFRLSIKGSYKHIELPDLMRVRVYFDDRVVTLDTPTLPMVDDIIEFDYRLDEWFIVEMG